MFNAEERKKELEILCNEYKPGLNTVAEIISQEKSMIEQAKKEAREEFAEKLKNKVQYITMDIVDFQDVKNILKSY